MSQAVAQQTFGECREGSIPHSLLRGIELLMGAPLMKKTVQCALCASTHAHCTVFFMAELLVKVKKPTADFVAFYGNFSSSSAWKVHAGT